jgi:hypothetical protein
VEDKLGADVLGREIESSRPKKSWEKKKQKKRELKVSHEKPALSEAEGTLRDSDC